LRVNTHEAELVATVHFAAKQLKELSSGVPSELDVVREVMQWKQRRQPPLDEKEVALATRNLNMLRWIHVRYSEDLPISEDELLGV